ncbi:hypothetical protein LCGC14_1838770, partial [marine sediment metagenome]
MALPVTIDSTNNPDVGEQNSYHGPFKSSGGNFYTILPGGAANSSARCYKATDPTSSFTEQDITNRPILANISSFNALSWWVFQDGDSLHLVGQSASNDVYYARFDMSSDTWVEVDIGDRDILVDTTGGTQTARAVTIGVRSTAGDIITTYQGDSDMVAGTEYERIDWNKSTAASNGAAWAGPVSIDNGGEIDWTGCVIVPGSSDRMHVFFKDLTNSDGYQRTIRADDSLETFPSSFDAVIGGTGFQYAFGAGASYDDAGTQRVRCPYRDITLGSVAKLDSSDTPTLSVDAGITANAIDGINLGTVIALAVDIKNLQLLYGDQVSDDLFRDTNDDDAGWGVDTLEWVGTFNHISPNRYDRSGIKIGLIVDDGGTVKYNEISLGGAGVTIAVPLATLSVANQVPVVASGKNIAVPVNAVSVANQAPQVGTSALVSVPLDGITEAGQVPAVASGGGGVAPADAVSIADQVPAVASGKNVKPPAGAITLADLVPAVGSSVLVLPPADAIGITDPVPRVGTSVAVAAPSDPISIADLVPQVLTDVLLLPPVDALSLSNLVPQVGTSALVLPPADAVSIADQAPAVAAGASVAPSVDSISVADQVPAVGTSVLVIVPLDAISLADLVPEIMTGVAVLPPVDAVGVIDFVPVITAGGIII